MCYKYRFGVTGWLVHSSDLNELYRDMPPRTKLRKNAESETVVQNAKSKEKLESKKIVI